MDADMVQTAVIEASDPTGEVVRDRDATSPRSLS